MLPMVDLVVDDEVSETLIAALQAIGSPRLLPPPPRPQTAPLRPPRSQEPPAPAFQANRTVSMAVLQSPDLFGEIGDHAVDLETQDGAETTLIRSLLVGLAEFADALSGTSASAGLRLGVDPEPKPVGGRMHGRLAEPPDELLVEDTLWRDPRRRPAPPREPVTQQRPRRAGLAETARRLARRAPPKPEPAPDVPELSPLDTIDGLLGTRGPRLDAALLAKASSGTVVSRAKGVPLPPPTAEVWEEDEEDARTGETVCPADFRDLMVDDE